MSGSVRTLTSGEVSTYYHFRVPDLRQDGSEWRGPCPIHKGSRDSFAVVRDTGEWFCHSGCQAGGTIFRLETELTRETGKAAARSVYKIVGRKGRQITEAYDYTDELGEVLFQCVRFDPKDFRQRQPDGKGGWVWNLKGVRLVPYRLPKVLAADTVYVAEGEKDVATLERFGLVATCNPMGAGKWRSEYNGYFQRKHVIILPDQDEVGKGHANNVAQQLAHVASSVKIVNVPASAKDVSEWAEGGGTAEDLMRLVDAAQAYQPSSPPAKPASVEVIPANGVSVEDFARLEHSDVGNAQLFVKRWSGNIQYVPGDVTDHLKT